MDNVFNCADCKQTKPVQKDDGTGYAIVSPNNEPEIRICYACAGIRDRTSMVETGKAVLYLTLPQGVMHNGRVTDQGVDGCKAIAGKVSNWPGTLEFIVLPGGMKTSRHNIAGKRYDVWFTGPDGATWHGVTYGDNTQICRCKRTKGE